jgi:LPXTG-motif cell wall-anchored protein
MRRVVYIAALAFMAMLVLAPGAMAQQMNHQHMMPNGSTMNGNMMASPSASASASPSATASTSASASPSAATTPSAPRSHHHARSHHHGGGGSSASAAVGGRLPSTGGVSLVSSLVAVGALALLVGFGLVAARLRRRNY